MPKSCNRWIRFFCSRRILVVGSTTPLNPLIAFCYQGVAMNLVVACRSPHHGRSPGVIPKSCNRWTQTLLGGGRFSSSPSSHVTTQGSHVGVADKFCLGRVKSNQVCFQNGGRSRWCRATYVGFEENNLLGRCLSCLSHSVIAGRDHSLTVPACCDVLSSHAQLFACFSSCGSGTCRPSAVNEFCWLEILFKRSGVLEKC